MAKQKGPRSLGDKKVKVRCLGGEGEGKGQVREEERSKSSF